MFSRVLQAIFAIQFTFNHNFYNVSCAGADWAAWLPGNCQVGRLVRRPSGPLRQMLKRGVERRRGRCALASAGVYTRINYLQGSPSSSVRQWSWGRSA